MKPKTKNRILKTITAITGILSFLAILSLDSESWIPAIVLGICMAWLGLFLLANKENL